MPLTTVGVAETRMPTGEDVRTAATELAAAETDRWAARQRLRTPCEAALAATTCACRKKHPTSTLATRTREGRRGRRRLSYVFVF